MAPDGHIDPVLVMAAAERLARNGWPVFPCMPGEKRPLTQHGLHDATTDLEQIHHWWHRTPDANLAFPTGGLTVDVLDVDVRRDGSGFSAFNDLKRAGLLTGHSRVIATPSGGIHVYFRGTEQGCSRLAEHHLDFKSAGGYVLAPPSVVGAGSYVVVRRTPGPHLALDWSAVRRQLIPDAASTVAEVSRHGAQRARNGGGIEVLAVWVATLTEGRRNSGTYWAACRAAEQGAADLSPLVQAAMRTGLTEAEAVRTIESARRRIAREGSPTAPTARGSTPVGVRRQRSRGQA